MTKKLIILILFSVFSFNTFAQRATQYLSPVPSPQSFVSQNVGMTKITVSYSSPGMKGRKIFGELVPYGKEWRAGANSPTVRMIPNKEGNWIVKLNLTNLEDRPPRLWKEGAVGFPYDYYKDGKVDMKKYKEDMSHSFEVEPFSWEAGIERLFYRIDPNDNKVAIVSMLWENMIIRFEVDTMTDEHLERFAKTLE